LLIAEEEAEEERERKERERESEREGKRGVTIQEHPPTRSAKEKIATHN
jgi:hypothetical protein